MDEEMVDSLRAEFCENRRHYEVVAEGLRGEIRQVAEGVAALDSALRELRSDMKKEFGETRAMIASLTRSSTTQCGS